MHRREEDIKMEAGTVGVWSQTQECWDSSLKLKRQGMDSPLEPHREKATPPDFGLSATRTLRELISVVLSHPICGNLLQQPHKTKTQLGLRSPLTPSLTQYHSSRCTPLEIPFTFTFLFRFQIKFTTQPQFSSPNCSLMVTFAGSSSTVKTFTWKSQGSVLITSTSPMALNILSIH